MVEYFGFKTALESYFDLKDITVKHAHQQDRAKGLDSILPHSFVNPRKLLANLESNVKMIS
jgi:hypothetical protein